MRHCAMTVIFCLGISVSAVRADEPVSRPKVCEQVARFEIEVATGDETSGFRRGPNGDRQIAGTFACAISVVSCTQSGHSATGRPVPQRLVELNGIPSERRVTE